MVLLQILLKIDSYATWNKKYILIVISSFVLYDCSSEHENKIINKRSQKQLKYGVLSVYPQI